ncbi:hypothetical protein FRE64_07565 [Euhalothece natronophila Z-M001]|uniref:Uncharacterized protein n=1 Tax=Euhalothece natronophila Z-M001 TaxID=522448 RepID=A0A5B8NNN9_9CHRO|nr:hypothetical protein [Euhalothece natronophila]QDZ39810.1 hypothetical protein FRE64_07565 [Euhalothece natronophila Z-M001]
MYITKKTSNKLRLEHLLASNDLKSRKTNTIVGSLFAIGLGVFIAGWGNTVVTLNCDRQHEESCKITSGRIFGLLPARSEEIPLDELEKAKVEDRISTRRRTSSGRRRTTERTVYRATLITDRDEIPLTETWNSRSSYRHEQVDKINDFIDNSNQDSLSLSQGGNNWILLGFGVYFFLAGVRNYYKNVKRVKLPVDCFFDKDSGKMFLTKQSPSSNKTETESYPLDQIKQAEIVSTRKSGTNVHLVLQSGKNIKLDIWGSENNKQEIVESINHFLQIDNNA